MKKKNVGNLGKKWRLILVSLSLVIGLVYLLNLEVIYQRGINNQVHTVRVPLYLKTIDFFSRHYNYKHLAKQIIGNEKGKEKRALRLLEWTFHNLKKQPESLPIVDDHVWHIIVRGYGINDQFSDVLATLCNYAGMDSFFNVYSSADHKKHTYFTSININGKDWTFMDPYRGVYFVNEKGRLASIKEMKLGNYSISRVQGADLDPFDYQAVFQNVKRMEKLGLSRSSIQSPLNRLMFQLFY